MRLYQSLKTFRKEKISKNLFKQFSAVMPSMSSTEKDAIEAGTVWWDADLFSGKPNWQKFINIPKPTLTAEEQTFMDTHVNTVCAMVDDWKVTTQDLDLTPETWEYIKKNKFLGMIIPKQYGGLGFSAFAHSEIMTKLSTRSSALAVSVMVPNSLGPGELLVHYGTQAQKDYYLPRLADGREIPAFALTSPWAGSDAAAIPDSGIVCKGQWNGEEVLGIKVTWDKRYITLAPVCTILGLAFRLYDPDGLLGDKKDIGITCALIPHNHPGVEIGRRHFPLNTAFMNGPTRGTDVFIPMDFIIGGIDMVGKGWRMLMECLAAGRAISLPSSNVGMSQLTMRSVGAYSRIRKQFSMSIGRFEGVEEVLARMAANTYMSNAVRMMTAGAVDLGEKPAILSAIAKYHVTETARKIVNDGMDVIGGKGICLGPSNFLGRGYQQLPVGITVEGANILTRSLIIFGQGAIRCHPYVLKEMQSTQEKDKALALNQFDEALWGHIGHVFKNMGRSFLSSLIGSNWTKVNANVAPETRIYYKYINRISSNFALMADMAMAVYGGSLKRKEKISARLGDVLSHMYLATATLKLYEDQGRQKEDLPMVRKVVQDQLYLAQEALFAIYANMPNRFIGTSLRLLGFMWGRVFKKPGDYQDRKIVEKLLKPCDTRNRVTANCYLPSNPDEPIALLERALAISIECEPLDARIRKDEKNGVFKNNTNANVRDIADAAFEHGRITQQEYDLLKERNRLRDKVIHVDDFPHDLSNPIAFMQFNSR
ncbi:acyl-CoA dehydrogenase [Pelistega suis]|uniref:Acyl-coenzyme A dehydrogenase n=1 Tax=Pelistega suis TaxID=1631957 RepID=A0A849PB16_9BURK|nr:acyl-CoA dehydrogenase [Pelistega suis]